MKARPVLLLLATAICLSCTTPRTSDEVARPDEKGAEEEPKSTAAKPLADWVAGCERIEGFVTLHRSKDKLYVELDEAQMGRELGFAVQLVDSVGDWSLRGMELDTQVVSFDLEGDRITLRKRNLSFRASANLAPVVEASFPDSPVFSAERLEVAEDGVVLFDAKKLFGPELAEILPSTSGFAPKSGSAALRWIKGFEDNTVTRVGYRFERTGAGASGSGSPFDRFLGPGMLADERTVDVTVDYHFFRLPDDDYRPRFADERIGGMTLAYKDYDGIDHKDTAFEHVLLRWDLRKQDPNAALSPPIEPVTFYVDRGVPDDWRELVHEGALWWNAAFERVGLRDAIRVVDQPDDPNWDPADLKHSMIYWNLSDNLIFSGLAGPVYSDPRTGKVIRSNVYLNGEFISYALHRYLVYAWWRAPEPGAHGEEQATPQGMREQLRAMRNDPHFCDLSTSFSSQIAFARLVLLARGRIRPGTPEAERFAREAFRQLVAHEVGHALGFPHNWKASLGSRWEELERNLVTGSASEGAVFSTSVMDYNPIYLAPRDMEQGDYFMREVGPFDQLMLEYIYRPFPGSSSVEEARALDAIAARAETAPGLIFDGGGLGHIDPTTNADDLGDDPVAFADARLAILREEVLPRLPELVLAEGHDYSHVRQALDAAIFSVAMDYIDMLARHVGGQILLRRVAHSPAALDGGPAPITPIAADVQRRAVAALGEHLFAPGAFTLTPETLETLKADMLQDWNYPWRYQSDYDVGGRIRGLYRAAFDTLLDPARLARVLDNERRVKEGEERFTLPELFGTLDARIFGNPAPLDADRRGLQRMWIEELGQLAFDPAPRTPAEAGQLARRSLKRILLSLEGLDPDDPYDQAHVEALRDRVSSWLEAKVSVEPLR